MVNHLAHLKEFEKVLKNYHISASGLKILSETKLALLVGPTSSGRNTIINALLQTGEYQSVVSDTTRKPRKNNGVLEKNGVEYWFRTEEDILVDLKAGRFLEAAVIHGQQVSGISMRELERVNKEHHVAINEIEITGMQNIIEVKPNAFALFVVPPSFETWMERLDGRGKLPAAEKRRRMESAIKEFEAALTHDYYTFIVNDAFEHSVERIHRRVIEDMADPEHQTLGREVTEKLLVDTQAYLHNS